MSEQRLAKRIGVWQLEPGLGRYEREEGDWHYWAQRAGFAAAPSRPRVLLFGESVARGLFYDPVYTLADLIAGHLGGQAEVIDLARTGAQIEHILATAASSRCLRPDAVVLFAGNNWKYSLPATPASSSWRDETLTGEADLASALLRQRESALTDIARRVIAGFCKIFAGSASVIVAIPESNLLDWHCQALAPVLGGGRERQWFVLDERLTEAMRAGNWSDALQIAGQLQELDDGVSGASYRAQGLAYLELGKPDEALTYLRRARDVRLWTSKVDPPWLPSCGAAAIREMASECGAHVVDLPDILPAHSRSGIPDGSVFADFCHLNSHGLAISAGAISRRLATVLDLAYPETEPDIAQPEPAVESGARFCAALIAADFTQPLDEIRSHARAAATEPEIRTAMEAYCTVPASRAPWWLRSGQFSLLPNVRRFVEGFGLTEGYRHYDRLAQVFCEQFGAVRSAELQRQGWAARSLPAGVRTDLLDPIFAQGWHPDGWEGLLDGADVHRHYFRAFSRRSLFRFNLVERSSLEVEITARLGVPGACLAHLSVNGEEVAGFPLSYAWRTHQLVFPVNATHIGSNEFQVSWERSEFSTQSAAATTWSTGKGAVPDVHPVFGEIYSFHVTPLAVNE